MEEPTADIDEKLKEPGSCKTVADILALATYVLGSPNYAIRWMASPIIVFSMKAPIDVMVPDGKNIDPEGINNAQTILMRIEYGIYS